MLGASLFSTSHTFGLHIQAVSKLNFKLSTFNLEFQTQNKSIKMFKYLVVLALALVAVMAAPPAQFQQPGAAPKDLQTANQLLYGYPSVYSAGVYPAYSGYYGSAYSAYSPYGYSGVYYG